MSTRRSASAPGIGRAMSNRDQQHVMSALVFLDTECTGLGPDDEIWEFAAIRRESDGTQVEHHWFIEHDPEKCERLPEPFASDHGRRWDVRLALPKPVAAQRIAELFTDRPHIVGAVPNFDTERIARLLRDNGIEPGWHYHLIDVENLAVGFLAGEIHAERIYGLNPRRAVPSLPWDSDELSRRVGVTPPTTERHTAMGDARWAMAIYDKVMEGK